MEFIIIFLFMAGFLGEYFADKNRKTIPDNTTNEEAMPMDYVVYEEILHSQHEDGV